MKAPFANASAVLYSDVEDVLENHGVEEMPVSGDHVTRLHKELTGHAVSGAESIWEKVAS